MPGNVVAAKGGKFLYLTLGALLVGEKDGRDRDIAAGFGKVLGGNTNGVLVTRLVKRVKAEISYYVVCTSGVPEIAWLERYYYLPPLMLAIALFGLGGLPWLVWGFCVPTVTLAHATFAINTVNHMFGSRRFETRDQSRNNVFTAFFAAGEGWHNNHHRYQRAARNGFYWWEFDPTWYVIRAMKAVGLVWDVQAVPKRIYEEARVLKAKRAASRVPSIVDSAPIGLELLDDEI